MFLLVCCPDRCRENGPIVMSVISGLPRKGATVRPESGFENLRRYPKFHSTQRKNVCEMFQSREWVMGFTLSDGRIRSLGDISAESPPMGEIATDAALIDVYQRY